MYYMHGQKSEPTKSRRRL